MESSFLAVDLGAESGRAVLGYFDGERVALEEVHRFPNTPVRLPDGLHWDVLRIFSEVKDGLAKAVESTGRIESLGVDSWGVDFALLDRDGALVSNPYHYRDPRTDGMDERAFDWVPREEIYGITGIQFLPINTLYQLLAMEDSPLLEATQTLLMIPDLVNYWLTGERACESTNASTTQLYDPRSGSWAYGLLEKMGLPAQLFRKITAPSTELGLLLHEVAEETGTKGDLPVTAVASHDTASAVVAIPAERENFAYRAINVMRGAHALGGYVSLTEEESYAVEYWPLELYKLTLAPPPKDFAGKVAFVTGGSGSIGSAVARSLSTEGACVVVCDLEEEEEARDVAEGLPQPGIAAKANVTDEGEVARAYRRAVLEYGGVDVVVSNAGLASSAPIEEMSVEMWDENHAVLAKGYFLVSREAFKVMKEQGMGGSLVFVASKNAMAAGKNASAYSSAKAAELHLARCLAEEGGSERIRVNTVNPDAVLSGSKIWSSSWREERAVAYGIEPEELEEHYRKRNVLKVNVLPENIAEAVLHFASEARSSRSTGNVLNVDGGVKDSYPR